MFYVENDFNHVCFKCMIYHIFFRTLFPRQHILSSSYMVYFFLFFLFFLYRTEPDNATNFIVYFMRIMFVFTMHFTRLFHSHPLVLSVYYVITQPICIVFFAIMSTVIWIFDTSCNFHQFPFLLAFLLIFAQCVCWFLYYFLISVQAYFGFRPNILWIIKHYTVCQQRVPL